MTFNYQYPLFWKKDRGERHVTLRFFHRNLITGKSEPRDETTHKTFQPPPKNTNTKQTNLTGNHHDDHHNNNNNDTNLFASPSSSSPFSCHLRKPWFLLRSTIAKDHFNRLLFCFGSFSWVNKKIK